MEQNGLDVTDWDMRIYRVFSIGRFKDLLLTKRNGLVRPSMWDDPFENFFLKCKARASTGELVSLEPISSSWYGQCWTMNRDSDAMWRIYSPKKDGVRVATTIRKLLSAIYDHSDKFCALKYFIGVVKYMERSEIESFLSSTSVLSLGFGGQPHSFARTLSIKRREFEHEKEVRLLINDVEKNMGVGGVVNVDFDHAMVLDEVTLDPRLEAPAFELVRQELIASGCSLPISQSELYKINETIIRLD